MHNSGNGNAPLIIDLNANLHLRLNNLTSLISVEHVKQLLLVEAK